MKKWYRGIVVKHKKIDNKMYHFFDDENFKILTEERNEQLKEIERLNNIINELEKWLKEKNKFYEISTMGYSYGVTKEVIDKLQELKEK